MNTFKSTTFFLGKLITLNLGLVSLFMAFSYVDISLVYIERASRISNYMDLFINAVCLCIIFDFMLFLVSQRIWSHSHYLFLFSSFQVDQFHTLTPWRSLQTVHCVLSSCNQKQSKSVFSFSFLWYQSRKQSQGSNLLSCSQICFRLHLGCLSCLNPNLNHLKHAQKSTHSVGCYSTNDNNFFRLS